MKESFWGYFFIALGVVIIVIIIFIQQISTTTEEDFYLGREVLEASMYDAVDFGTYESTGKLVMSKEKFVEVFIRRFAESVTNNKADGYTLEFYDIREYPPKASVRIRTQSGTTTIGSENMNVNLDTLLNGILVTNYGKHRLGDIDGNGIINTTDLKHLRDYIDDHSPRKVASMMGNYLSSEERKVGDINKDGKIDDEDYNILNLFISSNGKSGPMASMDLYDY